MDKLTLVYERNTPYSEMKKASCSQDSYNVLKPLFSDVLDLKERAVVLCLNQANKIIGSSVLSEGGLNSTVMDVRTIMQSALLSNASGVIIAHNHPSGNLKPSESDIRITKKVKEAGALMDITLLDHLIVTSEGYYSFADKGLI